MIESSALAGELISVVLPTRNRLALLEEALASLCSQTVSNWEAIVVDDASDVPISFESLQNRFGPRVRGLRHPVSRGGAAAKNSGIAAARGSVIAFLDDDDRYAPMYLERALAVLAERPRIQVVFMGVSWFGKASPWAEEAYVSAMKTVIGMAKGTPSGGGVVEFGQELYPAMLRTVPMAFQRPVIRREWLDVVGGYRDEFRFLWDCDWAIRAALHGRTALLEERLYEQRIDGQGISTQLNRELDHHLENTRIKDRLLRELKEEGHSQSIEAAREAASAAWFGLAYYQATRARSREALRAWCHAQRRKHEIRRYWSLPKLLFRAVLASSQS